MKRLQGKQVDIWLVWNILNAKHQVWGDQNDKAANQKAAKYDFLCLKSGRKNIFYLIVINHKEFPASLGHILSIYHWRLSVKLDGIQPYSDVSWRATL